MIIFLFNGLTMSIIQVVLLYYVKYVVLREPQSDLIMGTIFVVAMLALPLWEWTSRRLNKRWAYISGISFLAVVLLVLSSLTRADSVSRHPGLVRAGGHRCVGDARAAVGDAAGCDRVRRTADPASARRACSTV